MLLFRNNRVFLTVCLNVAILWQLSSLLFRNSQVGRDLSASWTTYQQREQQQLLLQKAQFDEPLPQQNHLSRDDTPYLYTPTIGEKLTPRMRHIKNDREIQLTQNDTESKWGSNNNKIDLTNFTSKLSINTTNTINGSSSSLSLSSLPMPSTIRDECFPFNSNKWINAVKFSNNDDGVTSDLLDDLLEGPRKPKRLYSVFDQTICHQDSPIRDIHFDFDVGSNNMSTTEAQSSTVSSLEDIEDWYQRFLYLAFHWKFHRPAIFEYRSRKACSSSRAKASDYESFLKHHGIGKLDFECPDAKFLVVPVASIGFGAYLNTQASLSVLMALKTNRIPVFSSKSFFWWQTRKAETDPWLLAPSRCDRKDLQCYFLPPSPCTVTLEELEQAPVYGSDNKEGKYLAVNMTIPPELENEKVVVINSGLSRKASITPEMLDIASSVIAELLEEWRFETSLSEREERLMEEAHRWITKKAKKDPLGLLRQLYVYMLRPNPYYKNLLDDKISDLVLSSSSSPAAQGHYDNGGSANIADTTTTTTTTTTTVTIDSSKTIGIAIRGSDKCLKESMCFPFDRYMDLAMEIAYPDLIGTSSGRGNLRKEERPKLILTTEDPKVFNDSLSYQRNESFPFHFLVNADDNMQGSGYPKDFSPSWKKNRNKLKQSDSDESEDTMISSLVALKFHFHAGRVYLNCCSNFHAVLDHLLRGQCGSRRHGHDFVFAGVDPPQPAPPVSVCLNSKETPRKYRLCCQWSKSKGGECQDIWKDYLRQKEEEKLLVQDKHGNVAIG